MPGQQTASKTEKEPVEIKLAHPRIPTDAFMFYALATHKTFHSWLQVHATSSPDIQSLNEAALPKRTT